MQHPCSIHATSMQHPCNGACGHTRYTGVSSPAPGALFTAQRCWSGCEACGGHVARRRGQHGMTCGQRGAREPRRRLNRQHARARIVFFCEHREEQVIYTTVLPALQSCRAVIEGCERFAIFKRRARVRIPTRSVSKCDCCAAAAACSLTPHADPANSRRILRAAAPLCACRHQPGLGRRLLVVVRRAARRILMHAASASAPGACGGQLQGAVVARAGNEDAGVGRAWRGKARVVSQTRGDARQSSPGSALGLAAGRHGGVKKNKKTS